MEGSMTWAKFDDTCPDHHKVADLSDGAHRLWFNAVCYANRMLTDGRIRESVLMRLYPRKQRALAAELVGAGLWHEVSGGWDIHDYLTYQPSKADVLAQRKAKAMAGAKGAASRWHGSANAPVPTDPVPTDPVRSEDRPLTPSKLGEAAARARKGSKRKRDQQAFEETATREERWLGKYAGKQRVAN